MGKVLFQAEAVVASAERWWRRGGLLVETTTGRVCAVGEGGLLERAHPGVEVVRFPRGVLLPGLVNAHSHAEYTLLGNKARGDGFPAWLERVVRANREERSGEFWLASARVGLGRLLKSGVTCVGEVVTRGASLQAAAEIGMRGVFFLELVGVARGGEGAALAELERRVARAREFASGREGFLLGLSPHSCYSLSRRALEGAAELARREGLPLCVHVAESREEAAGCRGEENPLGCFAGALLPTEFSRGEVTGGVVDYLESTGVLGPGCLAAHCVHLAPEEVRRLGAGGSAVCFCPGSNLAIGVGVPRVVEFVSSGAALAVGTDSLLSNEGLDLFREARLLGSLAPSLSEQRLFALMTEEGARALGLGETVGRLEEGFLADFFLLDVDPLDPVRAAVREGSPEVVLAVALGGRLVWEAPGLR